MYPYKLSVFVTTYNHEKYIREALGSLLSQQTAFDFEIIISDDVSTDRTSKIIEEYQSLYPNKIKVLQNDQNVGVTKNLKRGLDACTGEYIAILEGDDYWISNQKLQLQVDFLDKNQSCSMCFNGLLLFLESEQVYKENICLNKKYYDTKDLIRNNYIGNFSTCMYRNDAVRKLPGQIYETKTFDWMFNICISEFGLIGCIPMQMTAYRQHLGGVWSSKSPKENVNDLIAIIPIYDEILSFRHSKQFRKTAFFYKRLFTAYSLIKSLTPPLIVKLIRQITH